MSAGIHAGANNFQPPPVCGGERLRKKLVQFIPHGLQLQVAVDRLILDSPAFLVHAPADNLHFKSVVLHVHARGQHQHFFRDLAIIAFAAFEEVVRFDLFALFLPRFAHFGICPDF